MNFSLSEVRGVSWAAHDENLGVIVGFIVRLLCAQAEQPNLDHMLLEHIEGGKLHHFKAELDGRCPGVPTEGPVRV